MRRVFISIRYLYTCPLRRKNFLNLKYKKRFKEKFRRCAIIWNGGVPFSRKWLTSITGPVGFFLRRTTLWVQRLPRSSALDGQTYIVLLCRIGWQMFRFSSPTLKEKPSNDENKQERENDDGEAYTKRKDSCRTRSLSSEFKHYLATQV